MSTLQISNAPENLDLQSFRSTIDSYSGLALSCRYAVMIKLKNAIGSREMTALNNGKDFTYLCEATEFPGRRYQYTEYRYYGSAVPFPYITDYDPINMTFICRNDFSEREFFDDWMQSINPTTTYDFAFPDQYTAEIALFQMSERNEATYEFTLRGAYPLAIHPQPVSWADDSVQKLTITMGYAEWLRSSKDVDSNSSFSLVKKSSVAFEPKVVRNTR